MNKTIIADDEPNNQNTTFLVNSNDRAFVELASPVNRKTITINTGDLSVRNSQEQKSLDRRSPGLRSISKKSRKSRKSKASRKSRSSKKSKKSKKSLMPPPPPLTLEEKKELQQ